MVLNILRPEMASVRQVTRHSSGPAGLAAWTGIAGLAAAGAEAAAGAAALAGVTGEDAAPAGE